MGHALDAPPAGAFTAADRRALRSVAVQFFVNGFAFASFIPRLPEIRDRIGVSIDTLGLLLTAAGVIGVSGSVAASAVIARAGTRRTMIGGAVAVLAGLVVIGWATHPSVFLVGLGLALIFDVIVDIAMNLQGSWLSARRHAPVMNRLHGLWSLGTVAGGLVASRVAAAGVSLEVHLVVVAAVLLGAVSYVGRGLLRVDEHPPGEHLVGAVEPGAVDAVIDPLAVDRAIADRTTHRRSVRAGLFALALAGGFAVAVEITSSDWAAFRLSEDFGAGPGVAGLGFVAFTVGMTTGRFAGDSVLVVLGPVRLLRFATVVALVGLTTASFGPSEAVVMVGYAVAGIGISVFFPRLYDDAAKFRGRRGAGLAWMTAGSRITGLAVPTLVGVLAATSLSVGEATAIVALPAAIGFLVVSSLPAVGGTSRPIAARTD